MLTRKIGLGKLVKSNVRNQAARGGTRELRSVLLKLSNPRARLSHTEKKGKIFSALGELLWYLAKSNDLEFISYYLDQYRKESEDGATVYGAYGPRLFNKRGNDQVKNVLDLLGRHSSTRRAVIQLFDAEDIAAPHKEIPCTCTLQFMVRDGRLELAACMRSNDAFKGLPHDVFSFTMIQEIVARTLGHQLGVYTHFVGSLHLYDSDLRAARQYLDEGWQPTQLVAMPTMPPGDPRPSVERCWRPKPRSAKGDRSTIRWSAGALPARPRSLAGDLRPLETQRGREDPEDQAGDGGSRLQGIHHPAGAAEKVGAPVGPTRTPVHRVSDR